MESPSIPRQTRTQQFRSSYSLRSSNCFKGLSKHKSLRLFQIFQRQLRAALLERSGMASREFVLPLRPISKARPRSFQGQARPYMPVTYKNWIKDARMLLSEWWVEEPLEHVEMMDVHFYGPARGDLDNRVGSLCDAMNGLVIKDDNVNVLPRMRLSFTKAKTAEACIHIRITWGEQ
jgi:Holliday junction resolvase RusA-like endonuclease